MSHVPPGLSAGSKSSSRSLALGMADSLLFLAIIDLVGGFPHYELVRSLGAVVAARDEFLVVAVILARQARDDKWILFIEWQVAKPLHHHVRGDNLHQLGRARPRSCPACERSAQSHPETLEVPN